MNTNYRYGRYDDERSGLFVIETIVSRYIDVMDSENYLMNMTDEDQELFYTLNILRDLISISESAPVMLTLMPRPAIREMFQSVAGKKITTETDQSYISVFIGHLDRYFADSEDLTEEEIAAYWGENQAA
ncbi:hypothetical protein [Methylorubrum populi]|uniref:hypothetical protein n=1 Tax=Methylorubrum populi TaxID=223967 RepID=UPI003F657165